MKCNKAITIFKITTVNFASLQNFTKKQKCPNLVPEMPVLDVLNWNFGNNVAIFEISNLKFVYLQKFDEKPKCLNLGPETPENTQMF